MRVFTSARARARLRDRKVGVEATAAAAAVAAAAAAAAAAVSVALFVFFVDARDRQRLTRAAGARARARGLVITGPPWTVNVVDKASALAEANRLACIPCSSAVAAAAAAPAVAATVGYPHAAAAFRDHLLARQLAQLKKKSSSRFERSNFATLCRSLADHIAAAAAALQR